MAVIKTRNRWEVRLSFNGKTVYLGRTKTKDQAEKSSRLAQQLKDEGCSVEQIIDKVGLMLPPKKEPQNIHKLHNGYQVRFHKKDGLITKYVLSFKDAEFVRDFIEEQLKNGVDFLTVKSIVKSGIYTSIPTDVVFDGQHWRLKCHEEKWETLEEALAVHGFAAKRDLL